MIERRVGLLGGTFDPVHRGHLQMAKAAQKEFALDVLVFIPAGQPPHKDTFSISPFEHRVAMLEIICSEHERFECNAIEGRLAVPSYTIDTVHELLGRYGQSTQLFFLIGVDAFIEILTWKAHQDILKLINFIIFKRQGLDEPDLARFLTNLGYLEQNTYWQGRDGQKTIYVSQYVPDNVSSSSIREKMRGGYDCGKMLPERVFDYIKTNRLYS